MKNYDVRGDSITNNSLLKIQWFDGDMFTGIGKKHNIFNDTERGYLKFNKHKWLGGEVVVSYRNDIIYITNNGLKTNHNTAMNIKDAIKTGYTQDIGLLEY